MRGFKGPRGGHGVPWGPMGALWGPVGPHGAPWGPLGPRGPKSIAMGRLKK